MPCGGSKVPTFKVQRKTHAAAKLALAPGPTFQWFGVQTLQILGHRIDDDAYAFECKDAQDRLNALMAENDLADRLIPASEAAIAPGNRSMPPPIL